MTGFLSDPTDPRAIAEHELAMRYGHRDSWDVTFDVLERRHFFDLDRYPLTFSGDNASSPDAFREPHRALAVTDSFLAASASVPTTTSTKEPSC